jgi:sugar-specific transcriptional regulator TrmB
MDTKILEEIGLTQNESKVYLSLIELGSSSATQIIQKTGLHRAVVYDLLERLIEKGLVGHAIKARKKFFEATNPERLKEILQEREQKLSEILPRLMELSKFQTKLEVKIYKGKEGIKNVFEDILRSKPKEWLSLGSGGETYKVLPYFLEHFHKARVKNKILVRGLLLDNPTARKRGETLAKMPFSEIRYLPKTFLTPTVMNIYDNRVTLYSVTEENIPFIILIENKELSKSFKEYFEWLWKLSK